MITPNITFNGNCKDVLAFYQKVFNTELKMIQYYQDYIPEGIAVVPENLSEWVLHAEMEICGTNVWFADEVVESKIVGNVNLIKLNITVDNAKQAQQIFDGLNNDACITLPPTDTFYSTFHAELIDRYGIAWGIVANEASNQ